MNILSIEYRALHIGEKVTEPDYIYVTPEALIPLAQRISDYQNKYNAGLHTRKIVCVENHIIIDESDLLPEEDLGYAKRTFEAVFGEQNIIASYLSDKNNIYIYVYPKNMRILDPDKWYRFEKEKIISLKDESMEKFVVEYQHLTGVTPNIKNGDRAKEQSKTAEIDLITGENWEISDANDDLVYDVWKHKKQYISDMSPERFETLRRQTVYYFTIGPEKLKFIQAQQGQCSQESYLNDVGEYLNRTNPNISSEDKANIIEEVNRAVFGNSVLEEMLNADDISDIKVYNAFHIRVKSGGKRMTANTGFGSQEEYINFINALAIRYGLDLSINGKAINVFTDLDTNPNFIMRCNITTPLINTNRNYVLHIRKISKHKLKLSRLVELGVMPEKVAEYLKYSINNGSVVFCGKGGSGKTAVMNALIDEIKHTKSGLVVQETEELFSNEHPDFLFEKMIPESKYDLSYEAKNGLLIDLDYFIIGEIKGAEALYFLNAAATGHQCMCSVHGASAKDAIDKLADYVLYEAKYTKEQAMYMLKELKTVVFMKGFRVKEISEIAGWDEEKHQLIFKTMYKVD